MKTAAEFADASFDRVMAKDLDGWLALFADDALVRDPVGVSPHDPEGRGFRGKAEIARLWERSIATFREMRFTVRERYVGGDEAATLFTVQLVPLEGPPYEVKGIAIHTTDGQGKMQELSSYLIPAGTRFPA